MTAKEAWSGLLDDIKTSKCLTNHRQRKEILDKLEILRLVLVDYEEMKKEIIARQETENSLTQWVADLTTELDELKRDVARYFGLEKRLKYISENANTPYGIMDMKQSYRETLKELNVLEDKLMKIGNEE